MNSKKVIQICEGQLESQFIFFYNLGINNPRRKVDGVGLDVDSNAFVMRDIEQSSLNRFSFVGNLVHDICVMHFHAKDQLIGLVNNELAQINRSRESRLKIKLPTTPCVVKDSQSSEEDGWAPIEFTLFKNGMLSIIFRVTNSEQISDEEYVRSISKSEHVGFVGIETSENPDLQSLTQVVWNAMETVEKYLVAFLNELNIEGVPLSTGVKKPIKFHFVPDNTNEIYDIEDLKNENSEFCCLERGQSQVGKDYFHKCITRTRPYIGTVIDLSSINDYRFKEREKRLAIACARPTLAFLDYFSEPDKYLEHDTPRRNLYHPGPSIVFLGRRGWCCILKESRDNDPKSFHFGVVETVIFVIEAMLASTIHARSFIKDVTEEGDKKGLELLTKFQGFTGNKDGKIYDQLNPQTIYEFVAFVSRIKLSLPYQNLETLLSAHITTHTGIAAIRRMKYLMKHDELLLSAQNLVENYNSFFTNLDQYWNANQTKSNHENVVSGKKNNKLTFWGILAGFLVGSIGIAIALITHW